MDGGDRLRIALAVGVALLVLIGLLLLAGRTPAVRAVMGMIVPVVRLVGGLARDPRVSRVRRAGAFLLVGYLALPFDLVPDFLPVIGHLDDALVAWLALRVLIVGCPRAVLAEHWTGPAEGLDRLLRWLGRRGDTLPG